jgi:hypothetical protein
MLAEVPDPAGRDGAGSSLVDEIVREGARRMLAEALDAEVDAYIAQFADVRDDEGRRLVVRNGCHQPRKVLTSAGAVGVTAPRVNDKRTDPGAAERQRLSSAILPPWARNTPKVTEVLPLLWLRSYASAPVGAAAEVEEEGVAGEPRDLTGRPAWLARQPFRCPAAGGDEIPRPRIDS